MSLSPNYVSNFSNASKTILEALLYKFPCMKNLYDLLDLEVISSSEHPEVNNIICNFTNPAIIISIGMLTNCYIIQKHSKFKFHCIEISTEVSYSLANKGTLCQSVYDNMLCKDFVPEPLNKKLVFITDLTDGLQGIIYTKTKKGFVLGNEDINDRHKRVLRKNPHTMTKEILDKLE